MTTVGKPTVTQVKQVAGLAPTRFA